LCDGGVGARLAVSTGAELSGRRAWGRAESDGWCLQGWTHGNRHAGASIAWRPVSAGLDLSGRLVQGQVEHGGRFTWEQVEHAKTAELSRVHGVRG